MKPFYPLGLAPVLAFALLASVRPAAAAAPTVIAQAAGDNSPFSVTWMDDANGNASFDDQLNSMIGNDFAGLTYAVTDQQQLLLEINGSSTNLLIPPLSVFDGSGGTAGTVYYIVHLRGKSSSLDGVIYNRPGSSTPKSGFALLRLEQALDNQGTTATTWIQDNLTWSKLGPTPMPIGGF